VTAMRPVLWVLLFLSLEGALADVGSSRRVVPEVPWTQNFLDVGFVQDSDLRDEPYCALALVSLKVILTAMSLWISIKTYKAYKAATSHDIRFIPFLEALVFDSWNLVLVAVLTSIMSLVCYSAASFGSRTCWDNALTIFPWMLYPILFVLLTGINGAFLTHLKTIQQYDLELSELDRPVESDNFSEFSAVVFDGVNSQPNQVEQSRMILGQEVKNPPNTDEDKDAQDATSAKAIQFRVKAPNLALAQRVKARKEELMKEREKLVSKNIFQMWTHDKVVWMSGAGMILWAIFFYLSCSVS